MFYIKSKKQAGLRASMLFVLSSVLWVVASVSAAGSNVSMSGASIQASGPSSQNVTKVVLRVLGPDGKTVSLESNGSAVVFDASTAANGSYNYHTWSIGVGNDGNRQEVSNEKGRFTVVNGRIIPKKKSSRELGLESFTTPAESTPLFARIIQHSIDFLIPSAHAVDLIAESTIPNLEFNDTSVEGTDLDGREWLVEGRDQDFTIFDDSNDSGAANFTQVFTIEALGEYSGHPAITTDNTVNSIVIEDTGNIGFADGSMYLSKASGDLGLGTTTPDTGIHVLASGKSQLIKLENTAESTWTMGQFDNPLTPTNFDGDFQIGITTNGNGGPTGSMLAIRDQTGYVGINTNAPTSKLTVSGATDARVAIINSDVSSVVSRVLVNLVNNGAPVVQMNDSSSGDQWNFRTGSGGRFVIDSPGGVGTQMQVFQSGNVNIKGVLTEGSSRTYKDDIAKVDEFDVLAKLKQLDVSEWSYTSELGDDGAQRVRHVGPMAEDFHALFGLGATEKGIASLDSAGVALAAIKGLSTMIDQKSEMIKGLEQQNQDLAMRLEQLEKIVLSANPAQTYASN